MAAADLLDLMREALVLALVLSLPVLLAALVAGLGTAVLQLFTRLNEPTVTHVPRILAVVLAVLLAAPWVSARVSGFAERVWSLIHTVGS